MDRLSEKEKKAIDNFKYWVDTNTEKGVCSIPDYICKNILNLVENQKKGLKQANTIIAEQDEEIIEKNNKICDLEFKIDKQQKKELKYMNADEMFKKLGYEKVENAVWGIEYKKEFKLKNPKHIIFGPDKEVTVCEENERGLVVRRDYFDTQELITINEKVKELGWIN